MSLVVARVSRRVVLTAPRAVGAGKLGLAQRTSASPAVRVGFGVKTLCPTGNPAVFACVSVWTTCSKAPSDARCRARLRTARPTANAAARSCESGLTQRPTAHSAARVVARVTTPYRTAYPAVRDSVSDSTAGFTAPRTPRVRGRVTPCLLIANLPLVLE